MKTLTEFERKGIENTVADLFENQDFGKFSKPWEWRKLHKDWLRAYNARMEFGATKCVFIKEDCKWVLKFDMRKSDFCALESLMYEKSIEEGYSDYFPETHLAQYGDIHYEIQEKVDTNPTEFFDSFVRYCTDSYELESQDDAEHYVDELSDSERFEAVFGGTSDSIDACTWILNEMDNYECEPDFHEGNFGVTKDGRTVLFDFSGYKYV